VHVLAKPPVRKLAKTLGVDLGRVQPSGAGGTITREDVEAAAGSAPAAAAPASARARETRIPVRGVRKHTAAAMVASAFTAPHVTEFVTVDVTATMELRNRVAARREFRGLKVSPLLFVAKAVILAAQRTPEINASWDEQAGEIVLKHYVNLGIAAATDRGLVVPNIKDAERLSLRELAEAIADLTETARSGKTTPAAMTGGTITITNVGVFGVDTGTPILNPGEAGIVAFGAVRRMPWVVGSGDEERLEPRWVTQLAVSFDHRLVDGQQGSQFLADVAQILTDPGLALL
jgi:pyruvate dehydrogenase E2 component (dihydrolipoamide acetyltransferase)